MCSDLEGHQQAKVVQNIYGNGYFKIGVFFTKYLPKFNPAVFVIMHHILLIIF